MAMSLEGLEHARRDGAARLAVRKIFVDGDDVLIWYDIHTADTPPMPTANWSHVEDGKIATIRATFDPRPITGG